MTEGVEGKVIVITGASSGLGAASMELFRWSFTARKSNTRGAIGGRPIESLNHEVLWIPAITLAR